MKLEVALLPIILGFACAEGLSLGTVALSGTYCTAQNDCLNATNESQLLLYELYAPAVHATLTVSKQNISTKLP